MQHMFPFCKQPNWICCRSNQLFGG